MATENLEGNLQDFNWDEQEDFFGVSSPKSQEEVIEEVKKDVTETIKGKEEATPKEEKPKKEEKKEEEEPGDFFELKEKTSTKGKETSEETESYTDLFRSYKEGGLFKNVDIAEDEEIDEDTFFELQNQEYEAEVSKRLESWATEELDEDARAFIKFKREGGKTEDFFDTYAENLEEIGSGDITDEDYQDEVIRYQLKSEGWDKDEIEDRISYLTDQGKKEAVAEKYNEKIKKEIEDRKKELLKQAEENKKLQKEQEETYKKSMKEALQKTTEINGIRISVQDKDKLFPFLTKRDVKAGNTTITGFQKKLSDVFQSPEKMILLAKILENDFDFKDFEKQVVTKKTREVKENLEQRKTLRPSSGSSFGGKSLADLF